MRHSFSFAVTLHRVFDSAPPKAKVLFYAGNRQLAPVEKTDGLYVFLHEAENPLTAVCAGFLSESFIVEQGKVSPAILYPDRLFAAPTDWRLVHGKGEPDSLLYVPDTRYELKFMEHNTERNFARIRSRKGFTGGCLMFETHEKKEIALILEKQSPDIFYLSKLDRDYAGGIVRRVYCARTDAEGKFYLAVPEDFALEATDYSYL